MVKAAEFIRAAKCCVGYGYVWGENGEIWTAERANYRANSLRAGKSAEYYTNQCKKWLGKRVVDCSGLIVYVMRVLRGKFKDRNSERFYLERVKRYSIQEMPDKQGLLVYRQGHIGIYIGGGLVVEAAGTQKGVVTSKLHEPATGKAWMWAFEHKDIDFTRDESARDGFYVVRKGDTIYDIAKRLKIDSAALYALNKSVIGNDPDIIRPGMKLKLP